MSAASEYVQVLPQDLQTVLCIMGGPCVVSQGRRCAVPEGSKRVLVFMALHGGRVERRFLAGTLWPDGDDNRASGNLRSSMWRLRCAGIDILESDKTVVWLRSGTQIDIRSLSEWAGRVIDGTATESDLQILGWDREATDLLPGWYDDWVIFERERMRQRLLHALQSLSARLTTLGRYAEAVEAALNAVDIEPLRESAHRVLIEAHLAEGNVGEARKAFREYASRVRAELGVSPSTAMCALLGEDRLVGAFDRSG